MSHFTGNMHKYNLGVVGNSSYMAYVDTNATVSWLCWPQFDSAPVFSQLLHPQHGGHFNIEPCSEVFSREQYYLHRTNILCTEFECADGRFRVLDFAPRFIRDEKVFRPMVLVRKIEKLMGEPTIRIQCEPRVGYELAFTEHTVYDNSIRYEGWSKPVNLHTNAPIKNVQHGQAFHLKENVYCSLSWSDENPVQNMDTVKSWLHQTQAYWSYWSESLNHGEFAQEEIIRSALVLKMHQYEPTGAIIASGTTSLPESPGSGRSWDYRYCWVRDGYYVVDALNRLGSRNELKRFARFLTTLPLTKEGRYQPLYSIRGDARLEERILGWPGYQANNTVRVGNDAYTHIQNDVYGQMFRTFKLAVDAGEDESRLWQDTAWLKARMEIVEKLMDEPDASLWEFRTRAQHHSYSYLFQWEACKSLEFFFQKHGMKTWAERAAKMKKRSTEWIEKTYDAERGVYAAAVDSHRMDASNLQLITLGYLDPKSAKARSHLKVLEQELMTDNGLFYRYLDEDDFGRPDTTFLICAFWYVEALATMGQPEKAKEIFQTLLLYANHLGIFSEDVEAKTGSQWGNFPQTYSHAGLITSALAISQAENAMTADQSMEVSS